MQLVSDVNELAYDVRRGIMPSAARLKALLCDFQYYCDSNGYDWPVLLRHGVPDHMQSFPAREAEDLCKIAAELNTTRLTVVPFLMHLRKLASLCNVDLGLEAPASKTDSDLGVKR